MAHTAHSAQRTAYKPQHDRRHGFWYAETTNGVCIAIGNTRADVQKQINLFLGK